jgi:hypothetical protein
MQLNYIWKIKNNISNQLHTRAIEPETPGVSVFFLADFDHSEG